MISTCLAIIRILMIPILNSVMHYSHMISLKNFVVPTLKMHKFLIAKLCFEYLKNNIFRSIKSFFYVHLRIWIKIFNTYILDNKHGDQTVSFIIVYNF